MVEEIFNCRNKLFFDTTTISSFASITSTFVVLQSDLNIAYPWILSHYIQLISCNTYCEENRSLHIVNLLDAETAGIDIMENCDLFMVYQIHKK